MKVQNNVCGKSQDYNETMSCQEKCQRVESQLKKVLVKKNPHFFNYALLIKVQYILALLRTIIRTISVTCSIQAQAVFTFKLPQVFEEYLTIILPHVLTTFVYHCLPFCLPLLMGVICFKYTPVFGLLMRVCNRKGTGRVFQHKETAMYYK